MQITGLVVGWVLLGQGLGGAPPLPPSLGHDTPNIRPLAPANTAPPPGAPAAAGSARRSTGAADIMADAVRLPAGAAVTGRPLTLLAALSPSPDRRAQSEIVRVYWRLFATVAEYRYALDNDKSLESVRGRGREDASLRAARAAAAAQLRQSELEAMAAQHELAALLRLPPNAPMPLCADQPCVGAYRTNFKELFANRTPPEQARLADKILPLQHQVIDDRVVAVQAANDALIAVSDDCRSGRSDAAAVASCARELFRQRQALLRAVCTYNGQIADYAFLVVPPTSSAQELVRCLIGPAQPATGGDAQPSRQAGAGTQTPREPTLARRPRPVEPTPASPDGWRSVQEKATTPRDGLRATGRNEPTLAPPLSTEVPGARNAGGDVVRSRRPSADPVSPSLLRTTNKTALPPDLPGDSMFRSAGPSERFSSQSDLAHNSTSPALRAKNLTQSLQWDRAFWQGDDSKPASLSDCLLRDASGNRRATIEAYWSVWQQAARYKALSEEQDRLKRLTTVVLQHRNSPAGAADMLRLQAVQTANKAATSEAQVALINAQYALALRTGAVADASWPRPSTSPHSGSYLLKLEEQPRNVAESRTARRLATLIPGLSQNVLQRSTAVADAAAARTAAADSYRVGAGAIDQVIDNVANEAEETLAFIDTLTQYNRAIAEYALLVRPATTPADKLVESLVAKP